MSRHRNVRKLNIEEELEEDDDDFYEEEAVPLSPETSKFLYKRPGFPQSEQPLTGNRQLTMTVIKESERRNGKECEKIDEKAIIRPKPQSVAKSSPTKQKSSPAMAIPSVVENLRLDESAKVQSHSKSPGRTATPKQTLSNLELALAAAPKYRQRQRPAETQPALNLVIVGHVDAGKSTLVGHLLYLLGNVDERSMHRYRQDSSRLGKSSFAFAWILDESEEERTRGVTMDIARTNFEISSGRKYHILDSPGHKDFIPNMITGATQADAALLVVNATRGEFETGFDQGGQTREHAMLVRALGVSRLVVAVNKLDTCDWSQQRFDELCAILSAFLLRRAGFEQIKFVPVSGLHGINLVQKPSSNYPLAEWYSQGPTLVEALEWLPLPSVAANSPGENPHPMRAIVNDILRTAPGTLVLTAKLESGHIETGDKLFLMPEANPVTVKVISIDEPSSMRGGSASTSAISSLAAASKSADQQVCFAGDQAILTLTGAFEPDSVFPGHVLCRGGTELLLPCRQFRCQLVTFDIQMPILRGTRAELFIHSLRVPCVVSQLYVMHPGGSEQEKRNPRFLPRNVSAIVEIRTEQPISVEAFGRQKQLGRVALRAAGETIAAGIVLDPSTASN